MTTLRAYLFPITLLLSIMLGGVTGYFFEPFAHHLKPFGDIFLNLIYTCIVPLIFFNVSSAIARAGVMGKLGRIFSSMSVIFVLTSTIAAALAIIVVLFFPPALGIELTLPPPQQPVTDGMIQHLSGVFTVSDFSQLLSHQHMMALIIFSILVGLATASTTENTFILFLQAGEKVFMRVFSFIMYYAPIGFFAYFAVMVSELGASLMQSYARVAVIYYLFAMVYFVIAYSLYAYFSGKTVGVRLFWSNIFLPATTSIATCSSAASLPANLQATKAIGVPADVAETVIPLGTMIHKDGSVIGGVIKIAFLFGIFHLNFSGFPVLLTALGVSILVGTIMGAIPSGGMLGELFILSAYGLPSSALIAIAAISIIIDPIATMLNVTGNTVSAMMITRLINKNAFYTR